MRKLSKTEVLEIRNDIIGPFDKSSYQTFLNVEDQSLLDEIQENVRDGNLELCNVSDYTTMSPVGSDHESETVILLSNLNVKLNKHKKSLPLAIKIFTDPPFPERDNSLLVEIEIYKKYISKILNEKYSPNFIGLIGHIVCKKVIKKLLNKVKETERRKFFQQIEYAIEREKSEKKGPLKQEEIRELDRVSDIVPIHFLVLEQAISSFSLKQFIRNKNLKKLDLLSIFFQVIYSLEVLNRFNVRHNDLHLGNIFIIENKTSSTYYQYKVDGVEYYLSTKYVAKIYDWDRASVPGEIFNTLNETEMCKPYGACNTTNHKFDLVKFICGLKRELKKQNSIVLISFFKDIISEDLLRFIYSDNEYCFLHVNEADFIPLDKDQGDFWCMSTLEILKHKEFTKFQITESRKRKLTIAGKFELPILKRNSSDLLTL